MQNIDAEWLKNIKAEIVTRAAARTVTVTGDGKVTAHSDAAILSFSVMTQASTVKEVTSKNTQQMKTVTVAVKKFKINPADIVVSKYNLSPDYRPSKKNPRQIGSYTLEKEAVIKVKDLDLIDGILEVITKAGITKISLIFDILEPNVFKKQAREEALKDARTKAEEMAKVTGVKIGKVVTFSENEGEQYPGHSGFPNQIGFADVKGETVGPIAVVESGSKEFIASVNVTYEIES